MKRTLSIGIGARYNRNILFIQKIMSKNLDAALVSETKNADSSNATLVPAYAAEIQTSEQIIWERISQAIGDANETGPDQYPRLNRKKLSRYLKEPRKPKKEEPFLTDSARRSAIPDEPDQNKAA